MDTRTGLPVVGMVGTGPFARLMQQAAATLGQSLRVFAPSPQVDALLRFASDCDVVTFDPASVPPEQVQALAEAGVTVYPGAGTIRLAQQRSQVRHVADLVAVVARSPWGQVAAYPIARVVRLDGGAFEVLCPAPGLDDDEAAQAQERALRTAVELDAVGVISVNLRENQVVPSPGEAGLWTIDGARTSQFEQHLRAVLDYPLGATALTAPVVASATVLSGQTDGMGLDERLHHLFADDPGARVHLYGEPWQPGHLIGHVTVAGDDMEDVQERVDRAVRWLADGKRATTKEAARHE